MTNREFCISRRNAEVPTFIRVLKALTQSRLDYRPDPKARTAAELATALVTEETALATLLDTGAIDWKDGDTLHSVDEIVKSYEKAAASVDGRLAAMSDEKWEDKGRFMMGGKVAWEDTFGQFVWGFLFDAIHHRGQLTTYLRPMGGKVPSIYGPSADDPGQ